MGRKRRGRGEEGFVLSPAFVISPQRASAPQLQGVAGTGDRAEQRPLAPECRFPKPGILHRDFSGLFGLWLFC